MEETQTLYKNVSAAEDFLCKTCHGGNGEYSGRDVAHIPRPPQTTNVYKAYSEFEYYDNDGRGDLAEDIHYSNNNEGLTSSDRLGNGNNPNY